MGAFLKGPYNERLLVTVGKDEDNHTYPVAWAIVPKETKLKWTWFIRILKNDLGIGDGESVTIMSDMRKDPTISNDAEDDKQLSQSIQRSYVHNDQLQSQGIQRSEVQNDPFQSQSAHRSKEGDTLGVLVDGEEETKLIQKFKQISI
ncbi:hypothetical protein Cni_G20501 [Canna indica]|uniref:MULE transposase domain-containing protein n=1 Tax=Canna indica TaxID=4628 RepID=A0AAQ3KQ28_9LILI|nr:hypothetical protein Cni_G20501 [Canna indica]